MVHLEGTYDWPGEELVNVYGPQLAAALGAIRLGNLAADWDEDYPDGAPWQVAYNWLYQKGVFARLSATLSDVLMQLWVDGYVKGLEQARTVLVRRAVIAAVNALGPAWIRQIATTMLRLLARALVAGIALAAVLSNPQRIDQIVVTEVNRSMAQAFMDACVQTGVMYVRWLVEPGCCDECEANAAAGPWRVGVPFPSGALCPPQHPECRCWLEKVNA